MNGKPSAPHAERSAARLAALQALYQLEITGGAPEDVIAEFIEHRFASVDAEVGNAGPHDEAFFADVVNGVLQHQMEIDRSLARELVVVLPVVEKRADGNFLVIPTNAGYGDVAEPMAAIAR